MSSPLNVPSLPKEESNAPTQDNSAKDENATDHLAVTTKSTTGKMDKEQLIDQTEFELLYLDPKRQQSLMSNVTKLENGATLPPVLHTAQLNEKHSVSFTGRKRGRPKKTESSLRKQISSKSRSKMKSKKSYFQQETLPDRLKRKAKNDSEPAIDLTKSENKPAHEKTSYVLEKVQRKTYLLLHKEFSLCTLCGKPANFANLDALFGPYKLNIDDEDELEQAKLLSVWLHRDCAIWTPSICLLGCNLIGLGPALDEAASTKCSLCSGYGATLACRCRSCENRYHYVCAKQIGCSFITESYSILCAKHK